jgi:hypothetical protein
LRWGEGFSGAGGDGEELLVGLRYGGV